MRRCSIATVTLSLFVLTAAGADDENVLHKYKAQRLTNVYYSEGAYTVEDKQEYAERNTGIYTKYNLPAFYVSVMFHELPADTFYVGGEEASGYIRIWVDHIARRTGFGPERTTSRHVRMILRRMLFARRARCAPPETPPVAAQAAPSQMDRFTATQRSYATGVPLAHSPLLASQSPSPSGPCDP